MRQLSCAEIFKVASRKAWCVPIFSTPVPAEPPDDLDGLFDDEIDLTEYLVQHPESTFVIRATGESMREAGISPGDLIVVDRKVEPNATSLVVVMVDGEPTIKKISDVGNLLWLVSNNQDFNLSQIEAHQHCEIWGVVTATIRKF